MTYLQSGVMAASVMTEEAQERRYSLTHLAVNESITQQESLPPARIMCLPSELNLMEVAKAALGVVIM